jgi:hypothetical protein
MNFQTVLMRPTYRACAHSRSSYLDGAAAAFLEAGKELGHATGDLNAELQDGGFAIPDTTTRSGQLQLRACTTRNRIFLFLAQKDIPAT